MARGLAAAVAACLLLAGAGAVQVKVAAYDEPGTQGEVRRRARARRGGRP
jgi:acyl-coenzyme A thioesterase PaaI-like protein